MKKTIIIIVLSILGLLILTGEKCSDNQEKTDQDETIENEEEEAEEMEDDDIDEMESDTLDPDTIGLGMAELDEDAIGGADYNFLEAWEMSEAENYPRVIKLLNVTANFLEGEGEELTGDDAVFLAGTLKKIEALVEVIESGNNANSEKTQIYFVRIGLDLSKDYLAIAIEMNASDDDNEYFVSKSVDLLDKVFPYLKDTQKQEVKKILQQLRAYEHNIQEGNEIEPTSLKKMNKNMMEILRKYS